MRHLGKNSWAFIFCIFLICCTGKKEQVAGAILSTKEAKPKPAAKPYDSLLIAEFYHEGLAKGFDIKVVNNRFRTAEPFHDSCVAKFTLFDKATQKVIDTFSITSHFYFKVFEDKNNVRSYSTQFNKNRQILNGDYGDIVVADFNFDKKEDIAIVNNTGNYAGSFYNFYIQEDDRKFVLDRFLTDSVVYFPNEIKNNEIVTNVISGNCFLNKHIYAFDAKAKMWRQKKHIQIDVCKKKGLKK